MVQLQLGNLYHQLIGWARDTDQDPEPFIAGQARVDQALQEANMTTIPAESPDPGGMNP